jgi:DNA-binding transcriptional regulator YbjK
MKYILIIIVIALGIMVGLQQDKTQKLENHFADLETLYLQIVATDTLEEIVTEWRHAKAALIESAIYALGKNNHMIRGYCYALQAQDSIYVRLVNAYISKHDTSGTHLWIPLDVWLMPQGGK